MAITISGQTETTNLSINAPRNSQSLASYLNQNQNLSVSLPTTADGINLTSFGRRGSGTVWRLRNGNSGEVSGTLSAYGTSFSNTYTLLGDTDTFVFSPEADGSATHILEADGTTKIKAASSDTFTGGGIIGGDAYEIIGGSGDDEIRGRGQDDILRGGAGNDELLGQGGEDNLLGEAGSDLLVGGGRRDILTGGTESDEFRFTNQGRDEVTDFSISDGDIFQIDSDLYSNAPVAGTPVVTGSVGTAGVNIYVDTFNNIRGVTSSNVHFAYATNNNRFIYDEDGDWSSGRRVIADTNDFGSPTSANFDFI